MSLPPPAPTPPASRQECPLNRAAGALCTPEHLAVVSQLQALAPVTNLADDALPATTSKPVSRNNPPLSLVRVTIVDHPLEDAQRLARPIQQLQRGAALDWLDKLTKEPRKGYYTVDAVRELKRKLHPDSGYEILTVQDCASSPPRILGFYLYRIVEGKDLNKCDLKTEGSNSFKKNCSPLGHTLWFNPLLKEAQDALASLEVAIDVECVIDPAIEDPVNQGGLDADRFTVYQALHGYAMEELLLKGVSLAFATYRIAPAPNPVGTVADRLVGYQQIDPAKLVLEREETIVGLGLIQCVKEAILWVDTTSETQRNLMLAARQLPICFRSDDPTRPPAP